MASRTRRIILQTDPRFDLLTSGTPGVPNPADRRGPPEVPDRANGDTGNFLTPDQNGAYDNGVLERDSVLVAALRHVDLGSDCWPPRRSREETQ